MLTLPWLALASLPLSAETPAELSCELAAVRSAPEQLYEVAPLHFPVGAHLRIGKARFDVDDVTTTRLRLDNDGDGRTDRSIKGGGKPVALEVALEDGETFDHAVGLFVNKGHWTWRSMGVRQGKLLGKKLWILDRDANGEFDDDGEDVILIQGGEPTLLGDVLPFGDDWFEVRLDAKGTQLALVPFAGELGQLDVTSAFEGGGDLDQAIFVQDGGAVSFNASELQGLREVPVGDYELAWGSASKGSKTLTIEPGRMSAVRVRVERPAILNWGGPAYGTVGVSHTPGLVEIGTDLRLYGHAGEEYGEFRRYLRTPPGFVVYDRTKRNRKLGKGALCPT